MKKVIYNLYGIFNGKKDVLEHVFISTDSKSAELYFGGYIHEEEHDIYYKLYKIGNINNKLEIQPVKVFITGGYERTKQTIEDNTKYDILKLKFKLKEVENLDFIEQIEVLFDGKRID